MKPCEIYIYTVFSWPPQRKKYPSSGRLVNALHCTYKWPLSIVGTVRSLSIQWFLVRWVTLWIINTTAKLSIISQCEYNILFQNLLLFLLLFFFSIWFFWFDRFISLLPTAYQFRMTFGCLLCLQNANTAILHTVRYICCSRFFSFRHTCELFDKNNRNRKRERTVDRKTETQSQYEQQAPK